MSTRDLDSPPQPTSELPPFVFVPEDGDGTGRSEPPIATEPPPVGDPAPGQLPGQLPGQAHHP